MASTSIAVLFNGQKITGWADVIVRLMGRALYSIRALSYSSDSEQVPIYGAGRNPIGVGLGNRTYPEGSITMLVDEVKQLEALAPKGDLTQLPPIVIDVIYYQNGVIAKTDRVTAVFKGQGYNLQQGQTQIEVTLPLTIVDVQFNV